MPTSAYGLHQNPSPNDQRSMTIVRADSHEAQLTLQSRCERYPHGCRTVAQAYRTSHASAQ
eukprot:629896-Alexandrium_andersonii.AAC.1